MSSPKTSVVYKKANGSLTCDKRHLIWSPSIPSGATPSLKIAVADITNLQQTGEASAKVALKVLVKDDSYVFSFTSKDAARKEQVTVTDTLRDAIATIKAGAASSLVPAVGTPAAVQNGGGDAGQSASMAIAKALSAKPQDEGWYDDNRLKSDFQLQRSLLESSKALDERFRQALRDKPDTVSVPQFTAQFWSTRLHLLRAHAMEKSQKEGEYNVLPEIKYNTIIGADGEPIKTLNMTKEQVSLIFKQYPVVRQAYNETVPKPFADPKIFWSRFFASRLLKKLKGLRIEKNDPTDLALDPYLECQEASGPASTAHIPHIIDLEGNEQNTKFHLEGDYEMRAAKHDRPILHLLNQMSEKLLSHVAPEDGDAHAPIGMDEGTFEQLQLRDLAMQDTDNRVVLNVREQQRYTGTSGEDELSADARLYAKQDPNRVISSLQNDVQPRNLGSDEQGTLKLDRVLGYDSDDDDEDMDDEPNGGHTNGTSTRKVSVRVGSHAALTGASSSILSSVSQRRRNASSDAHGLNGLSQSVFDTLTITHNTTTEFLHYFWTLFLSGDSSRTSELTGLVSTLDRSLDRINAVGEQAEKERQDRLEKMRIQVKDYYPHMKKVEQVNAVDNGGQLTQITLSGELKPSYAANEAPDTEIEILEQTFDDNGNLKPPEAVLKVTTEQAELSPIPETPRKPTVPPFRDPQWEQTETSYLKTALNNLNSLTRSYNLMAPDLAKKPYFSLERELRTCFADVAPTVAAKIRERALAPKIKGVEVIGHRPGGVLDRFSMDGPAHVFDEVRPQYGFRQFWRDLFASKKS